MKEKPKTGYIVNCIKTLEYARAADFRENVLVTKEQLIMMLEGCHYDVFGARFIVIDDFKKSHGRNTYLDLTAANDDEFLSYFEPPEMDPEAATIYPALKLEGGELITKNHYYYDTKTDKAFIYGFDANDRKKDTWQEMTETEYNAFLTERAGAII